MNNRWRYILLSVTLVLSLVALWQVQRVADQIKRNEEEKVRLWATAIGQRNELSAAAQQFFQAATIDEHRKMQLYTDILESFGDPDMGTDLGFSLRYVNYIVDSSHTDIIIISTRDSIITVPHSLAGRKLEGPLLEEYSHNPPFQYKVWDMDMTLFYKESEYYSHLRKVLESITQSFLSDIAQNSVMVPVVILDSTKSNILAFGNIDTTDIKHYDFGNDPIEVVLPSGGLSYVYYSSTPLLRALKWVPILYLFIAAAILFVAFNLFSTARRAEQDRIWAGLAKETAHQLGTPLTSLSGWIEYLQEKDLPPQYATEIEKDIRRLNIIAQRFSKIGSSPELKEENVQEVTESAIEYLRNRSSRRISFSISFPENETILAAINRPLFQWVIENICKNAIDATDGEGSVTIVASHDARKIYIDIIDTGRGMTHAIARRIFDSGFTTKTRGWGLGLPLARRIINQYHRGQLYLKYSIPGQGSCFRIVLNKQPSKKKDKH